MLACQVLCHVGSMGQVLVKDQDNKCGQASWPDTDPALHSGAMSEVQKIYIILSAYKIQCLLVTLVSFPEAISAIQILHRITRVLN